MNDDFLLVWICVWVLAVVSTLLYMRGDISGRLATVGCAPLFVAVIGGMIAIHDFNYF